MRRSLHVVASLVLLAIVMANSAHGQCSVSIPANAIVIDQPGSSTTGLATQYWVCNTSSGSGFDKVFYVESGGVVDGSGVRAKAYVKAGGEYSINSTEDTVYYELGALITDAPQVAILCDDLEFDYSNAPSPGCFFAVPPPMAGIVSSADTLCNTRPCVNFMDNSTFIAPATWSWSFPGAEPTTASVQNPLNICYPGTGTFEAQLIVGDAGGADTATYSITILNCTGIEEFRLAPLRVHPVPTNGLLYLDDPSVIGANYRVMDAAGSTCMEGTLTTTRMDVSTLAPGTYVLLAVTRQGTVRARFVKE